MSRSSEFTRRRPGASEFYEASERPEARGDRQLEDAPRERAIGYSDGRGYDLAKVGVFGAGFAIGAAVGAAAALLLAPRTGEDARELIGEQARVLGGRAADSWDDLRDELRWLARRGRKSVRRGMTRGRWAAEDAVARGKRNIW